MGFLPQWTGEMPQRTGRRVISITKSAEVREIAGARAVAMGVMPHERACSNVVLSRNAMPFNDLQAQSQLERYVH